MGEFQKRMTKECMIALQMPAPDVFLKLVVEAKKEFHELFGTPYYSPNGWRKTLPYTQKVVEWFEKWFGKNGFEASGET